MGKGGEEGGMMTKLDINKLVYEDEESIATKNYVAFRETTKWFWKKEAWTVYRHLPNGQDEIWCNCSQSQATFLVLLLESLLCPNLTTPPDQEVK